MASMQNALNGVLEEDGAETFDGPFRLRSESQIERDKKIGAAGELFVSSTPSQAGPTDTVILTQTQVFELLSHLDPALPSFTRANWESTIRKYARAHPDYADMDPWYGAETSDITYKDTTSALTSFLMDKGYLRSWDEEAAAQGRPQYFIEVKSTTGPYQTPFYMSKYQYRRVSSIHCGDIAHGHY
jgi:hypothetical protein